jgi:heavy metal sensor kinase
MKQLKTLRVRFALWTAGLLLVTLMLFGLFVYVRMAQSLAGAVDDGLRTAASQIVAEVDAEDGVLASVDEFIQDMSHMPLQEQGFSFRVFDGDGRMLQEYGPYRALPKPQTNFSTPDQSNAFVTLTDAATRHPVRVYTAPIVDQDQPLGTLQVAQNLINSQQTLNQLLTTLLVGVPLVVVIAAVGGYVLAARALAPVDKITRTARRISAEDLSARLNLSVADDEVGRLADTFDSMLSRLEEGFERERQFTADASHELRTPLTTMQTILASTLARRRTLEEYEEAMVDLFEETHHMQYLTEGLLHLAHSDNSSNPVEHQPVDLSNLLNDVTDSLRLLAEDKSLELTTNIPDGLSLTGDSDALIRLFVNLLGNAIKYTEQGQITVVASARPDGTVEITISDTGIGIAPEHRPHIFDRFHRVDKSRNSGGTGLGLAIALNIAQTHGGTIKAASKIGLGTTFTVTLATG